MKVDGIPQISTKVTNTAPTSISYRTGDVVVVQALRVVNITPTTDEVILKFPNGDLHTAVFNEGFSEKQGAFFTIKIQSFNDKRIYAKSMPNTDIPKSPKNEVLSLLETLDIPNTTDSRNIATQILRTGANQTTMVFDLILSNKKKYPEVSLEQITFMVKNKIPFNTQTISFINSLMLHQGLVGDKLLLMLELINDDNKNNELKNLLKKFYKDPKNRKFGFEDIKQEKTIIDLVDILSYLIQEKSLGENTEQDIMKFLKYSEIQFAITKQMDDVTYLQIPINNNGNYNTAELYILNRHNGEAEVKNGKTLYLRIPTSNLGIVELLMAVQISNKNDKNIQCHFSAEGNIEHFKNNIIKLYDMLNDIGFHLKHVTYNQLPSDIDINNFKEYAELIIDQKKFDERV